MNSSFLLGLSILSGASLMLVATPASADVELAPLVTIDLSAYDGSGLAPEPAAGQLDSDDWSVDLGDNEVDFGEMAGGAGSDFARGSSPGDVDDGGLYAFDVDGAGLIAFGIQPTQTVFTPGDVTLRLVNNTGGDIADIQVEYSIWVNNNNPRSNSLNFAQSADDMAYTPVGDPFTSPPAADKDGFTETPIIQMVTPEAPIADGSQYYLQWVGDDVPGADTMERDEFGITGITIRILNACGNGLTEGDEACDDGLDNSDTGACTLACAAAACGDGLVQDGVEECDDMNTEDGDGCAADCTMEAATSDTDTDTDGDTDTEGDTDPTGGSGSDTEVTTSATMTGATATTPTTDPTGGSDTDGDTEGEDDDDSGCSCRSSGGAGPVWSMLGLLALGFVRRRR